MKKVYLFIIFLISILFGELFSQQVVQPSVKIKDHNGTYDLINIDCDYKYYPTKSVQLTAEYPIIGYPNDYTVSKVDYAPVASFSAGNLIHIEQGIGKYDDTFGDAVELPFTFCFYGKEYNYVIISDNGVVSFDTSQANKENPYTIAGSIPNTGLPKAAIFGAYHDMQLVDNSNQSINMVRVHVQGVAPYRQFIINYDNVPQFSSSKKSTSQIVLYETLNIVDVYIKEKALNTTTTKEKRALVGITNASGSAGVAAPDRNTGIWEAHNEAWRFTPSGSTGVKVDWYNEYNTYIGSGNPIVVTPSVNTFYTAKVTYNLCKEFSISNKVDIKFALDYPTANNVTMDIKDAQCIENNAQAEINLKSFESSINNTPGLTFTYYTSSSGPDYGYGLITDPEHYKYSTDNTVIYVKVLKEGNCYSKATITLRVNKKPKIEDGKVISFCDPEGDGEKVHLINQVANLLSGFNSSTMDIKFYYSLSDAQNNVADISNYTVFPLTGNIKLYFRVWNKVFNASDCYDIFSVNLDLAGGINLEPEITKLVCWVFKKEVVTIDLTQYESDLFNTPPPVGYTIKYYRYPYYNEITNPAEASITMDATVYIKVTDPSGKCVSTSKIILVADGDCDDNGGGGGGGSPGGGGGPGGKGGPVCNSPEGTYTVALDVDYLRFYLPLGLTLSDIEIVQFKDTKGGIVNTSPYDYTFTFTAPFFYEEITAVYKVKGKGITITKVFPISYTKQLELSPNSFLICNEGDEESKTISLSTFDTVFEELYGFKLKVTYFYTETDLELYSADPGNNGDKPKTTVEIFKSHMVTVWALVEFYGCKFKYQINAGLTTLEEIPITFDVCDFEDDGYEKIDLTKYEQNIKTLLGITPVNSVEIIYTVPNPTGYEMTTSPSEVYAYITIDKQCPIKVKIILVFNPSIIKFPEKIEKELYECDEDRNDTEIVNLSKAITNADPTSLIRFYTAEEAAKIGGITPQYIGTYDSDIINNPVDYFMALTATVYIRVEDPSTGCYKIFPLNISLVKLEDFTHKTIIACDNGVLGTESILLTEITNQLITKNAVLTNTMTYQYYGSESDANTNTGEILTDFTATNTNNIWVRITTNIGGCSGIYKLDFDLISPPVLNKSKTYYVCNNNTKNTNDEINEIVNLNQYNVDVITTGVEADYTFEYFYDAALTVPVPGNQATITTFPTTIWVKVTYNATKCYSVSSLILDQYLSLEGKIKDNTIQFCSENEEMEIDIKKYALEMVIPPTVSSDFTITYHYTKAAAVANNVSTIAQTLIDNGISVTNDDFFYIKFTDANGCFIIKKLEVVIYGTPKAQFIFPYICDETDGKLNGTYIIPDLDYYKNWIITGEPNLDNLYIYTYYKELVDAENSTNQLNKLNYTFTQSDLEAPLVPGDPYFYTVWVRVDKKDGTGCYSVIAITFNINPKVGISENSPQILECDESDNDGKTHFNLTTVSAQISITPGVTLKYYPTELDAQNNTNEIPTPGSWQNLTPYAHTVYVRVSAPDHCDNLASIELVVYPYIQVEDYADVKICEYESDGKTASTLNLLEEVKHMTTKVNSLLYPNLLDELDISFHTTLTDAQTPANALSVSDLPVYMIPVGTTELWIRFQSKTTKCYEIKKLTLTKVAAPVINDVDKLLCDDNLDGIYDLKLSSLDTQVNSTPGSYTITYHETTSDAETATNAIDKNTLYAIPLSAFPKTLIVRIQDTTTSCVRTKPITISTNPKVGISENSPQILECDESDNDGKTHFNLTTVSAQISITPGVTLKYYPTELDAQNNTNAIPTPGSWQNLTPYAHTVYVRVSAPDHCDNLASIELVVYPYIQVEDYADVKICEYESDGKTASTLNLLEEVKHMTTKVNSLLYPNLLDELDISFHTTLTDAQTPANALSVSDLPAYMIPVGTTELWIRFQSKTTKCYEIKKLTLTKVAAPVINDVDKLLCDDNLDGIYDLKLSSLDTQVNSTPGSYTITYHETTSDAETATNAIDKNTLYAIPLSAFPKTLIVRIQDTTTSCVRTKPITISTNPKVGISENSPQILECDESDNDGKTHFNLTTVSAQISITPGVTLKYYPTELDAQNNTNAIPTPGSWQNLTPYAHTVYVRVSAPDHCDNLASIELVVYPYIQVEDYADVKICEYESDGKTASTLNLLEEVKHMTTKVNSLLYPNLLDELDISFHTTLTDAQTPANALSVSDLPAYMIPVGTTELWIRFQSKTTKCYEIKKLTLTKVAAPVINDVDKLLCDDNLDGIYDLKLSSLDTQVNSTPGSYTITYHETTSDAETATNAIDKNTLYAIPLSAFPKTLIVRIQDTTTSCVRTKPITISTNPKVGISENSPQILECDESDNDGKTHFNLTTVSAQISITPGVTLKYYPTELDAQNNTNEIPTPGSWQNLTPYAHTVYVRVSAPDHCDNLASIELVVYPYIQVEDYADVKICEYESDGKTASTLNLLEEVKHMTTKVNSLLYPNLLDELDISFHTTLTDAQTPANALSVSDLPVYMIPVGTTELWIRFQSKTTKCYEIKKLTLTKVAAPVINDVDKLLCDDNLDGIYDLKLSSLDTQVNSTPGSYTITYHETTSDAETATNAIDKNTLYAIPLSAFPKTLIVRIQDTTTSCVRTKPITISTNPKVGISENSPQILECDESDNDGKTHFNLTTVSAQISITPGVTLKYYPTELDAQNNTNAIPTPGSWQNLTPYAHTVYVRVSAPDRCDNLASIELVVYPYIQVEDYAIEMCEFDDKGEPQTIDLTLLVKKMIEKVNSNVLYPDLLDEIDIKYYESEQNAIDEVNWIGSVANPKSLTEYLTSVGITTLWVRFQSEKSKCYQIRTLTLTKIKAPEAKPVTYVLCDSDMNGKYDDELLKNLDVLVISNPSQYIITYHLTKSEALAGTGIIDKDNYVAVDITKPMYARVEDKVTHCINVSKITFKTNPVISIQDQELFACDGDNDGYTNFNLNLIKDKYTVKSNLLIEFYKTEKEAKNALKDIVDTSIKEPELSNYINVNQIEDQVYVRVTDLDATYCPAVAKVTLRAYYPPNVLPKMAYICPRTEIELDAGEFDEYLWSTGETTRKIVVDKIGIYSVTVTKKDLNYGISCSATFTVEVKELEEPMIMDLQEGDDYITVIAKGPAPLEYSIDGITWQTSNTFGNLQPGLYTFYVRSKANGCESLTSKGIIFAVTNVITPNGDGSNDTWKLCGLEYFGGQKSHIKIFDRYGKEVFEKYSDTCFIWDGKYLGRNLPTTSYWYVITIVDGRQFTGWIVLRNYDENFR